MYKFAHFADVHLGAPREQDLRQLGLQAFTSAIDICISEGVNFVIIAGDLFDSNLPDMDTVNEAVRKIKEAHEQGIEFYILYGSHDYSANRKSMIDVLVSAKVLTQIANASYDGEKLRLDFVVDRKTGARICGLPGRKLMLEKNYYESLDLKALEQEPGFKIFCFHTSLTGFKPEDMIEMDSFSETFLPKGFSYYAGGHIHRHIDSTYAGAPLVYPGALFATDYRDLELMAKDDRQGVFIVEFDDAGIKRKHFRKVAHKGVRLIEITIRKKNSEQARAIINERCLEPADVSDKIILVKISGELSGGKVSDIDFNSVKASLLAKGAFHVNINRSGLTAAEQEKVKFAGESREQLEDQLIRDNVKQLSFKNKGLYDINFAKQLLRLMKTEKGDMTTDDYEAELIRGGTALFRSKA